MPRRKKSFRLFAPLVGALSLLLSSTAWSQITLDFVFDGTDTTLSYSVAPGTLGTLGGIKNASYSYASASLSIAGRMYALPAGSWDQYVTTDTNNPTAPWSAGNGTSVTGSGFALDGAHFIVPAGFDLDSITAHAGGMTFVAQSPINLGFASNTSLSGSYSQINTTVNWTVETASAVPEPSSFALFGGLAAFVTVGLRRRPRPSLNV